MPLEGKNSRTADPVPEVKGHTMNADNVLLVGATGQLGQRLARRFTASVGDRPRALVRSNEKAALLRSVARPVIGDLLVKESLTEAFRDVERVFIVAPPTPEMESLERNAIEAALEAGAKHLVYLSNLAAREGADL